MADDADIASDYEQQMRDGQIAAARMAAPRLIAKGSCHWCHEWVPEGATFCGADCRDDFDARQRAARRNAS